MKNKGRVCPICGDRLFSNEKSFQDVAGYEGKDVCFPCYISEDNERERIDKSGEDKR